MRLFVLLALVACHGDDWMQYRWDDRRIVCSANFDDLSRDAPWDLIEDELANAADAGAVTFFHAHIPTRTVSIEAITRMLDLADANGLDFVTFPELIPGNPRAGVAIAFDDSAVVEWTLVRDLLKERNARVTFFVTRLHLWTEEQLALLADLASDGHAIEAHAVNHLDALDVVCDKGAQHYLEQEALPSIEGLRDKGYAVTSYAFPFGNDHRDVHDGLLHEVQRLRVGLGRCPY